MKEELKSRAKNLRREGKSFREISEILKISKSTASIWTRGERMSDQGRARFSNLIVFSQLKAQKILLDKNTEYLKTLDNNCLVLKNSRRYTQDNLKMFLALLYWGEGSKTKKNFSFTNSDPNLVNTYLRLLKAAFPIDSNKLSAWLHLHDYHNQKEMLRFWSKITGIDKKRINIYNKHHSGSRKKENYKGCISVRYGDYRIFDEIMLIIKRFANFKI